MFTDTYAREGHVFTSACLFTGGEGMEGRGHIAQVTLSRADGVPCPGDPVWGGGTLSG